MNEALIAYLLADAGVSSAVSSRVYWNTIPQGSKMPAIVMTMVFDGPVYESNGESGLVEGRVQFDCYGNTYASAKSASRAIRNALSGKRFTQDTIKFNSCFLNSETDNFDSLNDGADKRHRVVLDMTLWHSSAS
jgi:hypothetical protein